MYIIIIVASFNASPHAPCTLRTEKHKALLKDEEWEKLPSKVQESPYFSDGKLLFDAERLGTWDFIGISSEFGGSSGPDYPDLI